MAESDSLTGWPRRYGRYLVFEEFARGGMASVPLGRLVADRGFSRVVAVKMLSEDRGASSFYARGRARRHPLRDGIRARRRARAAPRDGAPVRSRAAQDAGPARRDHRDHAG